MSEVDENPTRQVLPRPNDPCRRCEHPFSEHSDRGDCQVELSTGRVPTLATGGVCQCASFEFEPYAGPPEEMPDRPALDGPAMYAEALGYLKLAIGTSNEYAERLALVKASTYFAGASAYAMGVLSADNGTGDITERRWLAALAGEDVLPEESE
jgi:hypothetical protein